MSCATTIKYVILLIIFINSAFHSFFYSSCVKEQNVPETAGQPFDLHWLESDFELEVQLSQDSGSEREPRIEGPVLDRVEEIHW